MAKKTKPDAPANNGSNADRALASDEEALWQAVIEDVTPLIKTTNKNPASIETDKLARRSRRGVRETSAPLIRYEPKAAEPELSHNSAPGLDRRTRVRLRRGQLSIDATLDLHGMTQDEAYRALVRFLRAAYEAGRRTVLVITGKGRGSSCIGVLREAVPRWLNEAMNRRYIRGFAQAALKDGGEGALYVLVKRKRS